MFTPNHGEALHIPKAQVSLSSVCRKICT